MRASDMDPRVAALTRVPPALRLGRCPTTGAVRWLPFAQLRTSFHVQGPIHAGKTALLDRIHQALAFDASPALHLDYVGTGADRLQRFVAFTASMLGVLARLHPRAELAAVARAFLGR